MVDEQMVNAQCINYAGHEDVIKREVERYKLVVVGDEECGKTALLKSADFEVW